MGMFRAYLPVAVTSMLFLLHALRIHAIGIDRLTLAPAGGGRYQAGCSLPSEHHGQIDP